MAFLFYNTILENFPASQRKLQTHKIPKYFLEVTAQDVRKYFTVFYIVVPLEIDICVGVNKEDRSMRMLHNSAISLYFPEYFLRIIVFSLSMKVPTPFTTEPSSRARVHSHSRGSVTQNSSSVNVTRPSRSDKYKVRIHPPVHTDGNFLSPSRAAFKTLQMIIRNNWSGLTHCLASGRSRRKFNKAPFWIAFIMYEL